MAASAFFFALMSALVKLAGRRLPTQELVLVRSVAVLVLAWGMLRWRGRGLWGKPEHRRILVLRGTLGFIALSCFYYGVIHLPLADATVIQYTNPVWTALIAAVVLSEPLRAIEIALALVSLGGVVLVARPSFLFGGGGAALPAVAVAVALVGSFFSAGAYVAVRRLAGEAAMVIVFWFALISTAGALPAVIPTWVQPRGWEWAILLGVGVSTHLGQVFLTWGLQRERAGRAMAVGYLQIVFAALWGALIFSEIPDLWSAVGTLLIIGSTFTLARAKPGEPRGTEPAS